MLKLCLAGLYPVDVSRIAGGPDHVMFLLANAFAERNDVVLSVVAPVKGLRGIKEVQQGKARVFYVGTPSRRIIPNMFTQGAKIAAVLRKLKPDVVNSHDLVTTDAGIRAGRKVIHTIHGVKLKEAAVLSGKEHFAALAHAMMERRVVSRSDAILSVAQYGLDCFERWISSPSYVINVPVEDVFFQTPPMKPCKGILFVGMIGQRKNLMTLVEAMVPVVQKHPDVVLTVCGKVLEPDYFAALESFVKSNGLDDNVRFMGVVDRKTIVGYLEGAICLALPSKQETSPGVICQAMAAGRPVVASNVGGIPEMLEEGVTGFLVDPEDPETLADRMIRLLDAPEEAAKMGEAARRVAADRYDAAKVADQIVGIAKEVAASDQKPRNSKQ